MVNEPEDHLALCTASRAEMNFNVASDEAFNNAGVSGDELQLLSNGSAWPSAKTSSSLLHLELTTVQGRRQWSMLRSARRSTRFR